MRERRKTQKRSESVRSTWRFSLNSLPDLSTILSYALYAIAIFLIFAPPIAFGQLWVGEDSIFGRSFGDGAVRLFGQMTNLGLFAVCALGVYLFICLRFPEKVTFQFRPVAFLTLFFLFISWIIQRSTTTNHPFEEVSYGGGAIVAAVDQFMVAAIGTIGTVFLMMILGLGFLYVIWERVTRFLPDDLSEKLSFTRRITAKAKELLLIPDDKNAVPDSDERIELKPLSDMGKVIEEKELKFQDRLKAILKRNKTQSDMDDAVNVHDDGIADGGESKMTAGTDASDSPTAPRQPMQEFTPTRAKANRGEIDAEDEIIHVRPFAKRVDAPPLTSEMDAETESDAEILNMAAQLNEDTPAMDDFARYDSSPLTRTDGIASPSSASSAPVIDGAEISDAPVSGQTAAAPVKAALPKVNVFVAPKLENIRPDKKRQSDSMRPVSNWTLPDPEVILDPVPENNDNQQDPEFIRRSTEVIEEVLRTQNAPGQVVDIRCGPTFTQFGVQPGFIEKGGRQVRVRVNKIESLVKDLEMNLEVRQLRIEAPIPGKTYIGMQVQNPKRQTVPLRDILGKGDFRKYRQGLPMSLGIDINGDVHCIDLTRMPHLLIAGETGSGKSVCLNIILANLLMYNDPDKLKLILIDPKRVELSAYAGVPHLITPVITDTDKSSDTLQYALGEMERRNLFFREMNTRNIQDFNAKHPDQALPYIVIVIDELASLMMTNGPEIEQSITRLAQMARAMGIHLIVATQRPSRDVITGTIKGNLPSRIAFHVPSNVDSQVILDRPGAEHLFGQGDMLLMTVENSNFQRLQGAFVSTKEIQRLVGYWKTQAAITPSSERDTAVMSNFSALQAMLTREREEKEEKERAEAEDGFGFYSSATQSYTYRDRTLENADSALGAAIRTAIRNKRISATLLVTELEIGYTRASKILFQLEELGIIAAQPDNHTNPWRVIDAEINVEQA